MTVIPSEIADLGDCTDDKTAKKMADAGVDVINCPEYEEGPETIVLDPDVAYIQKGKSLVSGKALPIPPPARGGDGAIKDAMREYDQAKKSSKSKARQSKTASASAPVKGDAKNKKAKRRGRGQGGQRL